MERIYKLDDENIIIVNNVGKLTQEIITENRAACKAIIEDLEGPVVLIIDQREVEMNFADMIRIIRGNQEGRRAELNQRAFSMMIGSGELVTLYRDSLQQPQSGGVMVPIFDEMDAALEAGRVYLAQESADDPPDT